MRRRAAGWSCRASVRQMSLAEMGDGPIAGPFMTQMAFEQGEMGDREGRAGQGGMGAQERVEQAAAPTKARERDMRPIGARFGRQADGDAGAVDLAMQAGQRVARFDPGPQGVHHPLAIKCPDPGERRLKRRETDGAQGIDQIIGAMAIDLSDETQGQVELVVGLPSCAGDAAHEGEQRSPVAGRWTDGDEQAVHDAAIATGGCRANCNVRMLPHPGLEYAGQKADNRCVGIG